MEKVTQFLQCMEPPLADIVFKSQPGLESQPLKDVIRVVKGFAVIKVATGVTRSELLAMRQDHDEPIRTFAARVKSKADVCQFEL